MKSILLILGKFHLWLYLHFIDLKSIKFHLHQINFIPGKFLTIDDLRHQWTTLFSTPALTSGVMKWNIASDNHIAVHLVHCNLCTTTEVLINTGNTGLEILYLLPVMAPTKLCIELKENIYVIWERLIEIMVIFHLLQKI